MNTDQISVKISSKIGARKRLDYVEYLSFWLGCCEVDIYSSLYATCNGNNYPVGTSSWNYNSIQ